MEDNVNKELSTSYRQSLERNIEQLLEEHDSKEPSAKKQKLDTDTDLKSIYWRVCICNALLAATNEQPISNHHFKLLKHATDCNYQFMCEVSEFMHVLCCMNINKTVSVSLAVR